ncbi:MAG: choice-of-anchor J domain-containing protein [Bacteroidales bacterium]
MKKILLLFSISMLTLGVLHQAYATTCDDAIPIPGTPTFPYVIDPLICGTTNDIHIGSGAQLCGNVSSSYLLGNEAVYVWTPANDYLNVTFAYSGQIWTSVSLYEGCPTSGGICMGGIANLGSSKTLNIANLTANTTYYLVIDIWLSPSSSSPCPGKVTINGTINPPCSGTPDPGHTISSVQSACPGFNFTLSLQNLIPGSGVTYQWQYSVTGVEPWTDIMMGTEAIQAVSLTVPTYYRCYVTCTSTQQSAFSTPLFVPMIVAPSPYEEGFLTTVTPQCWDISGWFIGSPPSISGNPGNSIYKYFDFYYPTASFRTGMIGPVSTGMTLTFDYKVANNSQPYAPPAIGSGNFVVAVSDNGGDDFDDLETIVNNGVAGWQTKSYQLDNYDGKNIIIKIIGNRTVGNWGMGFDNIKVAVPPACLPPFNLTVSDITTTSAKIGWTKGGDENEWDLEYGPKGFNPGEGILVTAYTDTWTTLNDLDPNTEYDVYARAVCSEEDLSPWAVPVTFTTKHNPATLPFSEGFEIWPNNWYVVNGAQPSKWHVGNATKYAGNKSAYISNDGGTSNYYSTAATSVIHLYRDIEFTAGSKGFDLYFYWKGCGEKDNDYMRVFLVQPTVEPVAGSLLDSGDQIGVTYNLNENWNRADITLPGSHAGTVKRLVFTWRNNHLGGTQPPVAIDNILLEEVPCPKPANLNVSDINATSAKIGWTSNGDENKWDLEWGPKDFELGNGTQVTVGTNTYKIEYLYPNNTEYDVYVRAVCDDDSKELSSWAGPVTFKTLCIPMSVFPWTEDFEGDIFPPPCWSRYDIDEWDPQWASSTSYNHTQDGSKSAFHADDRWGYQEGWLVTPQIQLPQNSEITFSFWSYNMYPIAYGHNYVLISEGSGVPVDGNFIQIWSPNSVTESWVKTELDLTSYAGKLVYLAFRYKGTDAHIWYLDDVSITAEGGPEPPPTLYVSGPQLSGCKDAFELITIQIAQIKEGIDVEYRAGETINATGFTVEANAAAYLYAGENIVLGGGILVSQGADFLATIMDPVTYCQQAATMVTAKSEEIAPAVITPAEMDAMFHIFPNPTTGRFTLLMKETDDTSVIYVEIFDLMGKRVLQTQLFGQNQYEFDLSGSPKGVYIVRVLSGKQTSIGKLIKQ